MKVGFYFDSSHLKDFSYEKFAKGRIGISGTDSSFFRVIKGLTSCKELDIYLFAKNIDDLKGLKFKKINSIEEAIANAKDNAIDIFIFNLRDKDETRRAVSCAQEFGLTLIPWAQNPIESSLLDLLTNSNVVVKIVYVEEYDLNHTRHRPGFYKGVVIPNGVEKEIYVRGPASIPNNLNVCYLGSLTPSKGFHHVARAWPEVLKKVPSAKLNVIGSGKLYNNFTKLGVLGIADEEYEKELMPFLGRSKEELIKNNIECYGLLSRNEIIDMLYNTKVACMNPNVHGSLESCSVSSLEIQLCGVPVIAGRAGGNLNTIVNDRTGILIKDPDKDLANAIVKLLTDDVLNLAMRNNAREYILGKYEMNLINMKWLSFLRGIQEGNDFPMPKITSQMASLRLLAKEGIRLLNRILR